jgi:hypothetical protein
MANTTWRALISVELAAQHEDWNDVIANTLKAEQLDEPFFDGYGGHEGVAFTMWTKHRVYFPVVYDGAEWAASVPRDPCDEATPHVGGE